MINNEIESECILKLLKVSIDKDLNLSILSCIEESLEEGMSFIDAQKHFKFTFISQT